jgi:hypothetical protein
VKCPLLLIKLSNLKYHAKKEKESSGILKNLTDNFGLGTNLQYSKLEGLTNKTINKTRAELQFNEEKITPALPCIY